MGKGKRVQKGLKRAFDLGFTVCAGLVLLPVALFVAVLVRTSSPGPILYATKRVGRRGTLFTLYKFRTMEEDADRSGPAITHRNDRRVTAIGRLLRKTKFDEFPQVVNVLRGEMSIIGPRPEDPKYVELYTAEQKEVLLARPGLTSLAQVTYRREEDLLPAEGTEAYYLDEILPRKLALDLYYVRRWSLWLDAKVFLCGILSLLSVSPPAYLWPIDARLAGERNSGVDNRERSVHHMGEHQDGAK